MTRLINCDSSTIKHMDSSSVSRQGMESIRSGGREKINHENCRAWLTSVLPKHSTQDFQKDKEKTEEQLFNDLKDGKLLCRLLQFFTKEEIAIKNRLVTLGYFVERRLLYYLFECFSTNNVSSLEENNINLFLTNLSKLKISGIDDKLFGEKRETVFRDYVNFSDILNGIAKLSRQLEKKTNVRGLDGYKKTMRSQRVKRNQNDLGKTSDVAN